MSDTKKKNASGRTSSSPAKKTTSGKKTSSGSTRTSGTRSSSGQKTASSGRTASTAKKPAVRHTTYASSQTRKKLTTSQRRELERQQHITQLLVLVGCILVAFIILMVIIIMSDREQRKKDYAAVTSTGTSDTTSSGIQSALYSSEEVYPASREFTQAPDGEQLKKPAKGEEVAVFETSMGTIKIRLFPEYVPTAVENFKTLIKNGYYDGITFHRVMDNFMIQSGDPTGTGTGGDTAFEGYKAFEDEFGRNLYNIRGAVSMANAGTNTNSSQFFIVQTTTASYGNLVDAETFVSYGGAQWAADAYEKNGGTPYLDGQFKAIGINSSGHTVFGQVYEGMKIVDKIAGVETDSNDKPLKDVTIKKAYLETVK